MPMELLLPFIISSISSIDVLCSALDIRGQANGDIGCMSFVPSSETGGNVLQEFIDLIIVRIHLILVGSACYILFAFSQWYYGRRLVFSPLLANRPISTQENFPGNFSEHIIVKS
jgi:hypothetical protein